MLLFIQTAFQIVLLFGENSSNQTARPHSACSACQLSWLNLQALQVLRHALFIMRCCRGSWVLPVCQRCVPLIIEPLAPSCLLTRLTAHCHINQIIQKNLNSPSLVDHGVFMHRQAIALRQGCYPFCTHCYEPHHCWLVVGYKGQHIKQQH